MRYLYVCLALFVSFSAALAETLSAFDANSTYSAQSRTYAAWAPNNVSASGGIIFGKGQARFLIGNKEQHAAVEPKNIRLRFEGQHLEVLTQGRDQAFRLEAHAFAVCPMARHVARDAPIAFTIPPYLDSDRFQELGLSEYQRGFIAAEFKDDKRVAELVRSADFWPVNFDRSYIPMNPEVNSQILKDVNSTKISEPSSDNFYNGLTYFSGDFHTNAIILLGTGDNLITVFGAPIVYIPELGDEGEIKIQDVEFLGSDPEDGLAEDGSYGPRDFQSLFDLSLIFTAVREEAPGVLSEFIKRYCGTETVH